MKTTKFLSMVLAVLMLVTTCIGVGATELTSTTSGNTKVTYGVSQSFLVTIPSEIQIGTDGTGIAEISLGNVMISHGNELAVIINSDNYNNGWNLIDEENSSNKLVYAIGTAKGSGNIANNSVVITAESGEIPNSTKTSKMYFTIMDDIANAGSYKDILTFTAGLNMVTGYTVVALDDVIDDEGVARVGVGQQIQLSAAATYGLRQPTWTSNNTSVVTVTSTGLAVAKAEGEATITYAFGEVTAEILFVVEGTYDNSDNMITFSINGVEHQEVKGTTWEAFDAEKYGHNSFYNEYTFVYVWMDSYENSGYITLNGKLCNITDVIVDNANYILGDIAPFKVGNEYYAVPTATTFGDYINNYEEYNRENNHDTVDFAIDENGNIYQISSGGYLMLPSYSIDGGMVRENTPIFVGDEFELLFIGDSDNIITFTINGSSYVAPKNTTWEMFDYEKYGHNSFDTYSFVYIWMDSFVDSGYLELNGKLCSPEDAIVGGAKYTVSQDIAPFRIDSEWYATPKGTTFETLINNFEEYNRSPNHNSIDLAIDEDNRVYQPSTGKYLVSSNYGNPIAQADWEIWIEDSFHFEDISG